MIERAMKFVETFLNALSWIGGFCFMVYMVTAIVTMWKNGQ